MSKPAQRRAESAATRNVRAASKASRHRLLRQLLADGEIRSQRELVDLLSSEGLAVTQTTISRDLDELGAERVRAGGGGHAYTLGRPRPTEARARPALRRHLEGSVAEIGASGDMVVVKTLPGHAQFVASAIDDARPNDIVGTVAGDDTVLLVATERAGAKVKKMIEELSGLNG